MTQTSDIIDRRQAGAADGGAGLEKNGREPIFLMGDWGRFSPQQAGR